MNRRIIVTGYHHSYCRKLIDECAEKLGSIRKVSFAIGLSQAQMYRYYHNEVRMNDVWIKILEQLRDKLHGQQQQ
jgi:hypothetical protein